ncbi:MAG: hypothetical protein IH787_00075 [Nitrospirae bacterium]|nr:hypothetical protein [Nitrospirota bacterium]
MQKEQKPWKEKVRRLYAGAYDPNWELSTMEAIVAAGRLHSGREGDYASFERNGLRIAVLAYAVTKNYNLLHDYELAEETVVVIAHRLSTLHHVDRIVVVDRGRIVEQGLHEDLLTRGGLYAGLYEAQFQV